mmetsp:Transcript_30166/g.42092  ORF Transcript_30166/g.42092 Transcript_30166/m.42092 type:complete len:294 (+) Transcript_30166:981-1862(+)
MILCIALGIVAFGVKTTQLFEAYRTDNAGYGRFHNPEQSQFVVLVGEVSEEILKLMSNQLLHPDRFVGNMKLAVLVSTPEKLTELRSFIASIVDGTQGGSITSEMEKNIQLFVGNPLEEEDLSRLQVEKAAGVYILGPEAHVNVESRDLRQLFTAVAIRRYLKVKRADVGGRSVPIKVTVTQKRFYERYQHPLLTEATADVDVICYNKLIASLLASSCFAPGFLTFLMNLVTNIGDADIEMNPETGEEEWLNDYMTGASYEVTADDGDDGNDDDHWMCGISKLNVDLYSETLM